MENFQRSRIDCALSSTEQNTFPSLVSPGSSGTAGNFPRQHAPTSRSFSFPFLRLHRNETELGERLEGEKGCEEMICVGPTLAQCCSNKGDDLCARALAKLAVGDQNATDSGRDTRTRSYHPFWTKTRGLRRDLESFSSKNSQQFSQPMKLSLSVISESQRAPTLSTPKTKTAPDHIIEFPRLEMHYGPETPHALEHRSDTCCFNQSQKARAVQIQEHLQRTEKEYNIVENKAKLVADWLQTLEN